MRLPATSRAVVPTHDHTNYSGSKDIYPGIKVMLCM